MLTKGVNGLSTVNTYKMINNLLNNFADNYRGERETGKIKGLSTYMVGGRNLCEVKIINAQKDKSVEMNKDFKPFIYNILQGSALLGVTNWHSQKQVKNL